MTRHETILLLKEVNTLIESLLGEEIDLDDQYEDDPENEDYEELLTAIYDRRDKAAELHHTLLMGSQIPMNRAILDVNSVREEMDALRTM